MSTPWRILRWEVFRRDGYQCQECSSFVDLTVDHIVPRSAEGTNDFSNLRTLCRKCNSKKGGIKPSLVASGLHRTSVMLPTSLLEEANAAAAQEGISFARFFRRALRRELDRLARAQARRSA